MLRNNTLDIVANFSNYLVYAKHILSVNRFFFTSALLGNLYNVIYCMIFNVLSIFKLF